MTGDPLARPGVPGEEEAGKVLRSVDRLVFYLLAAFLLCSAFSIALSEIAYFSALTIWLGKMVWTRKNGIPRLPVDFAILAYAAAEAVATLLADEKLYSLLYLQRRLLLLPIMYLLAGAVTDRRKLQILIAALVGSAVAVALWSSRDLVLNLNEYLHFRRRMGEFQIYMTAGGIMMIALLLVLPVLVHRKTPKTWRWIAAGAAVPLALNQMFTFTRSSWLGFLAGVVVIAFFRSKTILLVLAAAVVLIFFASPKEIRQRIASIVNPSHPANTSRVNMWKTGLRIIRDHPLFGIGDVGTETVWNRYSDPGWDWEGHLHNNIIMWFVTLGAAGFAALAALFVKLWLMLKMVEAKLRDDWLAGSFALGGLAVLAGFHVNGLFEWNFGDAEVITIVWAIAGLAAASGRIAAAESSAA